MNLRTIDEYNQAKIIKDLRTEVETIRADLNTRPPIRKVEGVLVLENLTTVERNSITAVDGMLIYNTTTNKVQARVSGSWVDLN